MRNLKSILIVIITINLLLSCNNLSYRIDYTPINKSLDKIFVEKKYAYTPVFKEFNNLGKDYYFIKIWGFLKYNTNKQKGIDWDDVFVMNYSKISQQNRTEFNTTIDSLLNTVVIPSKKNDKNNENDYALIDNSWFYDSLYIDKKISNQLKFIFENKPNNGNRFVSNNTIGNLTFNEKKYDSVYPKKEIRMLSLARYWNIINYFYVYKNYMDIKWDDVLLENISEFKNADTDMVYHKNVQKLSSYLNDCHSMVRSSVLDKKVFGRFVPNFRLKMINDTFVVSKFRVPEYSHYGLQVGDIILALDSVAIKNKYDSLKSFFRGANRLTEQRVINPYLLTSTQDKLLITYLRNRKIYSQAVSLSDYSYFVKAEIEDVKKHKQKVIRKAYSDDIIYINLDYIFDDNFEKNFSNINQYKNLILDLRCYPREKVFFSLTNYLLSQKQDFFLTSYSDVSKPGVIRLHQGYKIGNNKASAYKGNVFVLVNEHTQSMAEFLVMALQTASNVTVIGSQTAGSDGNVTKFSFPGKIRSIFTGIGVYYPDTTQTQRKGVKLTYEVNQTIRGIQNQKDEILDFTINLINHPKIE